MVDVCVCVFSYSACEFGHQFVLLQICTGCKCSKKVVLKVIYCHLSYLVLLASFCLCVENLHMNKYRRCKLIPDKLWCETSLKRNIGICVFAKYLITYNDWIRLNWYTLL